VLASPLFLLALLAVIRGWRRDALGTLLVAATLTYTFSLAYPAGCAEPPLLLFEAIAIGALTFIEDERAQTFLTALGVAGAVFTKLEGATFAVAVFLTILLVQRKPKRAFIVIAPGALLFAAWMTFVFRTISLMYGAQVPIYWSTIRSSQNARENREVRAVVAAVPRADRADRVRRETRARSVAIALLTTGAAVLCPSLSDPVWWIEAPRRA
jgi:hypothetical protein